MNDKKSTGYWRKYFSWFVLGVILIVIFKTIDSFSEVFSWIKEFINLLMPFFLAALFAFILYGPCRAIEKLYRKIKWKFISKRARVLSVATVYALLVAFIAFLINTIYPALKESVLDLANVLPNYLRSARDFILSQPEDSWWVRLNIVELVNNLEEINISEVIISWLEFDNVSKYIEGITNVANVVFDTFVTIVVSIYILLERADIKNFGKNLIKAISSEESYKKFAKYYRNTNSIFYRFISAQIFDAIIVGILTSIAMSIMNVKYAVLLGFLIGVTNIIPYFGAIIGIGITIIITIFSGGLTQAAWLLLVLIILQQIDANIINPKILGNSLQISRILIIFSITFFGAYFGVLGMFLAVPIIALIKVFIIDFINEKNQQKEQQEPVLVEGEAKTSKEKKVEKVKKRK